MNCWLGACPTCAETGITASSGTMQATNALIFQVGREIKRQVRINFLRRAASTVLLRVSLLYKL
jgi:hypothetical protein